MKMALMQPYFFPYLGYFQLIHAVDRFIVYDDVQYMKGGWINRNRILFNGEPAWISLPVPPASVQNNIKDRCISAREYPKASQKILGQLHAVYRKAAFYEETRALVQNILACEEKNLALFLTNSLRCVCEHLGIATRITLSSDLEKQDAHLSGVGRVLEVCRAAKATMYVNAIGGRELYRAEDFAARHIDLRFIAMDIIEYNQGIENFVPYLSIIDVLMYNGREATQALLQRYTLQS